MENLVLFTSYKRRFEFQLLYIHAHYGDAILVSKTTFKPRNSWLSLDPNTTIRAVYCSANVVVAMTSTLPRGAFGATPITTGKISFMSLSDSQRRTTVGDFPLAGAGPVSNLTDDFDATKICLTITDGNE